MSNVALALKKVAYKTGGPFPLASGGTSDEYLDVKNAILHPTIGLMLARAVENLVDEIKPRVKIDAVAGVLVGGALLAKDVARNLCLPCLAVRTEGKNHGLPDLVLGLDNVKNVKDRCPRVVLVEDVITKGTSVLKAMSSLSQRGVDVAYVLAVVDREQGGVEVIRQQHPSVRVEALTTLDAVRRAG